jgi:hypothetical protein
MTIALVSVLVLSLAVATFIIARRRAFSVESYEVSSDGKAITLVLSGGFVRTACKLDLVLAYALSDALLTTCAKHAAARHKKGIS